MHTDVRSHLIQDEEGDRDDKRAHHRGDFAPGVHPPPEPADEIKESGPRADLEYDVERLLRAVKEVHSP